MVLLRDRAGNPLYFIGQAVDISERKEAETRAAEAEAQLRQAIAAMDDGFVLFDKDDQLVIWNDRFAGLYDSVADHLAVGLSYQQLSQAVIDRRHYAGPPPSLPSLLARRARLRADQSTLLREQRLADGRWLEIKETSTPDGEIVGICVDITAQKARETALRQAMEDTRLADRAKSEFLANMSHELRTPLNAIIGFSEILWQELFGPLGNPLYQEYAEGIHESGRHLLQIIGDILDLSKIEAGELSLDIESLDLSTIIDSALRMIRARAQSRKIGLELALAPAMPRILGDELRVKHPFQCDQVHRTRTQHSPMVGKHSHNAADLSDRRPRNRHERRGNHHRLRYVRPGAKRLFAQNPGHRPGAADLHQADGSPWRQPVHQQ
jgi:two-component system cell cycle sensor histidine kinase PleC